MIVFDEGGPDFTKVSIMWLKEYPDRSTWSSLSQFQDYHGRGYTDVPLHYSEWPWLLQES